MRFQVRQCPLSDNPCPQSAADDIRKVQQELLLAVAESIAGSYIANRQHADVLALSGFDGRASIEPKPGRSCDEDVFIETWVGLSIRGDQHAVLFDNDAAKSVRSGRLRNADTNCGFYPRAFFVQ